MQMTRTILVAEDDFIAGVDITDTCQEAGYWVEGPHTGINSAMLALQKKRPDLAILDLRLQDGPVLALARKLHDENVPIIFHAGEMYPEDVGRQFPGAAKLVKPCPPARFIDTINRMLDPV
jgi:two-component system, response regulator PdtaR